MLEQPIIKNYRRQFNDLLKAGEVPHPEISIQVIRALKGNFPFLESPRPELSGLLTRSDEYAAQLIAALESPQFSLKPEDLIPHVVSGMKFTPERKLESFDNGNNLRELLSDATPEEQQLLIFNMVVKTITQEVGGSNETNVRETRLNSLLTLLLAAGDEQSWPKILENFVGAGKTLDRIVGSTSTNTDLQIVENGGKVGEAVQTIRKFDVADTTDSMVHWAKEQARYITGKAFPKAKSANTPVKNPW